MAGTYCITHVKTGHFYIGSTGDFVSRKYDHVTRLNRGIHYCENLQKLYNEDNAINFSFYPCETREKAYDVEKDLIHLYADDERLCNTIKKVSGGPKKHTAEAKERMAQIKTGKVHTAETLTQMSITRTGKTKSPEWSDKIAESRRKKVSISGVVYRSITEAATAFNLSGPAVAYRCDSKGEKFKDWHYV